MDNYYSSYYLVHHGIKGMKWGIRRYQNEDGTLTEAGKKRYGGDVTKVKQKHLKRQIQNAYDAGNLKKSIEIGQKAFKEGNERYFNSPEKKEYDRLIEEYRNKKTPEAVVDGEHYLLVKKEENRQLNEAAYKARVVRGKEFSDAVNTYTSALLSDLGYEDSTPHVGRVYVYQTILSDPKLSSVLTEELRG